jgi:DNA-directed RNA polymerase specialized sigma24 family protein
MTILKMVIEELLEGMPEANRRMIELRIEGYEVAEITEKVQRSKRTVERVLQGFRNRLEALIHEDHPE